MIIKAILLLNTFFLSSQIFAKSIPIEEMTPSYFHHLTSVIITLFFSLIFLFKVFEYIKNAITKNNPKQEILPIIYPLFFLYMVLIAKDLILLPNYSPRGMPLGMPLKTSFDVVFSGNMEPKHKAGDFIFSQKTEDTILSYTKLVKVNALTSKNNTFRYEAMYEDGTSMIYISPELIPIKKNVKGKRVIKSYRGKTLIDTRETIVSLPSIKDEIQVVKLIKYPQ